MTVFNSDKDINFIVCTIESKINAKKALGFPTFLQPKAYFPLYEKIYAGMVRVLPTASIALF